MQTDNNLLSVATKTRSTLLLPARLLTVAVLCAASPSIFAAFALPTWAQQLCIGYTTSTQSTSTSTSSSTLSVPTNISTAIQTQAVRVGESLAVSAPPSHGTASVNGAGDTVNYASTVGYSGSDTVVTQFTSLSVSCQVIVVGNVTLGTNLGINQNVDTKTITLNVAATNTQAIPTLSEWGMIMLSGLVGLGTFMVMRRRPM